ncbi:unnamed protein product, partial [Medioppia subpectinata]
KLLRCTVGDVFKCLADCPLIVNNDKSGDDYGTVGGNSTTNSTTGGGNNTTGATNTAPPVAQPSAATIAQLTELQTLLSAVNNRFRELETACTLLTPLNAGPMNLSLGNSSHLGQDPHYDKTNLYADMISAYRWSDKMVEYSTLAATYLQQNPLRRSHITPIYVKGRPQRRPPNGHNIGAQQIDIFIGTLQRLLPDLTIEVTRPFGAPTVLKVTIPRVLRAVILLRGLLIEWVVVKGFDETFDDPNFDNSHVKRLRRFPETAAVTANMETERLDIWSESKHEVFRKVSEHANAAMLHYYSPIHCDVAIRTYLNWLKSYANLFSAPCRKCNARLQNFMPPTWRDIRTFEPYHEQCRP